MAERYIDVSYVDACLEQSVRVGLLGEAAVGDLWTLIEGASAIVAGYLRNSGYLLPATTPPSTIADVGDAAVKQAVMCVVWEQLAARPNQTLMLPENWASMPYRIALDGILSGTMQLGLQQSAASSPGGFLGSDRASRAGRDQLGGY
jgi:hypothetical protein